jgi:ATP-dependent RNA helicase DDX49/DBP8
MATLFGPRSKRKRKTDLVALENNIEEESNATVSTKPLPSWASLDDLGLAPPLLATCRQLGFQRPTPIQRAIIPFLISNDAAHILALAPTGTGKTASFVLPIIHRLVTDPYGIYAVVLTPTRELAKQIHQQVLALGSAYSIKSALVVGGLDSVRQSTELDARPHFCVATPGRLAQLLRGPQPPHVKNIRYMVLDEADRLLATNSGFERDVAELLLHCTMISTPTESGKGGTTTNEKAARKRREQCQTLLFSATMTKSLEAVEELAGAGKGRLPLHKVIVRPDSDTKAAPTKRVKKNITEKGTTASDEESQGNDNEEEEASSDLTPRIPAGLKQEYVFMPSRVRDAYLVTVIRTFMANQGRRIRNGAISTAQDIDDDDDNSSGHDGKARSAIVFVSTCERAGFVSGLLSNLGIDNVALHSLLSQNRRLAALGKFKSQHVRVLVATVSIC